MISNALSTSRHYFAKKHNFSWHLNVFILHVLFTVNIMNKGRHSLICTCETASASVQYQCFAPCQSKAPARLCSCQLCFSLCVWMCDSVGHCCCSKQARPPQHRSQPTNTGNCLVCSCAYASKSVSHFFKVTFLPNDDPYRHQTKLVYYTGTTWVCVQNFAAVHHTLLEIIADRRWHDSETFSR